MYSNGPPLPFRALDLVNHLQSSEYKDWLAVRSVKVSIKQTKKKKYGVVTVRTNSRLEVVRCVQWPWRRHTALRMSVRSAYRNNKIPASCILS